MSPLLCRFGVAIELCSIRSPIEPQLRQLSGIGKEKISGEPFCQPGELSKKDVQLLKDSKKRIELFNIKLAEVRAQRESKVSRPLS